MVNLTDIKLTTCSHSEFLKSILLHKNNNRLVCGSESFFLNIIGGFVSVFFYYFYSVCFYVISEMMKPTCFIISGCSIFSHTFSQHLEATLTPSHDLVLVF
ncbi:hypothetical protein ATANTOWER_028575 [Ataeniobius toweri]|uniref:Uncharacterized protein n=1 Tax=Ataeniobius toweri TaxID=208326 RepID=A0ABU7CM19_9TELE|nr:hypothetical protein [Ataeniobius toweri]